LTGRYVTTVVGEHNLPTAATPSCRQRPPRRGTAAGPRQTNSATLVALGDLLSEGPFQKSTGTVKATVLTAAAVSDMQPPNLGNFAEQRDNVQDRPG
jgi:hypothetical protein